MAGKSYYYVDATVLLEEDFYLVVENLVNSVPDVCFLLDASIYREISGCHSLGKHADALLLENFVNLFATLGCAAQVDTKDGFDSTALAPMAPHGLTVITQRQKPVDNFSDLGGSVQFLRFAGGCLEPWPPMLNENGKAFYLEKDYYINKFDIENIDYVFSPRYGYLKLDKSESYSGGEGVCYRTYNGLFCKLYFRKHITYTNFKRLQTMVDMGCTTPFITWPLDIPYFRNQFVGYVMDELKDTRSVDMLRDDGFSGFTLLDRFHIVRNFLKSIEYLHARDILVGDMKLDNILVKSNADVYIIDSGSFQVEDYACDVCHKEYTERIYVGDQLKQILRSVREEYFPINKIIFEILMMKGPFYSRDNTEIDGDGARIFTYPMTPEGLDPKKMPYHLKVWFSLSPAMRTYFYRYFTEGKVTYVTEWIKELDIYIAAREAAAKK